MLPIVAAAMILLVGCAPAEPPPSTPTPVAQPAGSLVVGGDRPVTVQIPEGHVPSEPAPLLLVLHAFGSTSEGIEAEYGIGGGALERGWIVVVPDGTTGDDGRQFWNAGTPRCCNLFDSDVDDSAYLADLIDNVGRAVEVDPARVFLFGHSNGGFMTYRMACDHAETVAALVSLAGLTTPEEICDPSGPVHVLQIHGTDDGSIRCDGESDRPSADEMVRLWAAYDGCDPAGDASGPALDLDGGIDGDETHPIVFASGCAPGGSATLWTIDGGEHRPTPSASFGDLVLDFLDTHPKPIG